MAAKMRQTKTDPANYAGRWGNDGFTDASACAPLSRLFLGVFGRKALGPDAATFLAAEPAQLDSVRIFTWISRRRWRIGVVNLSGRAVCADVSLSCRQYGMIARTCQPSLGFYRSSRSHGRILAAANGKIFH
jgi:hypothetical protein